MKICGMGKCTEKAKKKMETRLKGIKLHSAGVFSNALNLLI